MTRDDIIRMARESGLMDAPYTERMERFAALVAAATEREMRESGWRQCAKGQRTTQFCGQLEAEREKLKSLYDQIRFDEREESVKAAQKVGGLTVEGAAAIRARGEK